MVLQNGKLTAQIPSAPLKQVMDEFSRITGISVLWKEREIERTVSAEFSDRSPVEAAINILHGESYILFSSSNEKEEGLSGIMVLPRADESKGLKFQPNPDPHKKMYSKEMKHANGREMEDFLIAKKQEQEIEPVYAPEQAGNESMNYKDTDDSAENKKEIGEDNNEYSKVAPSSKPMEKSSNNDYVQKNNSIPDKEKIAKIPGDNTYGEDSIWDDFEDGDDEGWQPDSSGRWSVENTEDGFEYSMMPIDPQLPSFSLIEDLETTDKMTISVKALTFDEDDRDANFFIVFGYDDLNDRAYFAGARVNENKWVINETNITHNSSDLLYEDSSENINATTWYDIQLVISGTNVTLYAKESADPDYGTPKARFDFTSENGFPDGIPDGKIGLGGLYSHTHFDDFSVTY